MMMILKFLLYGAAVLALLALVIAVRLQQGDHFILPAQLQAVISDVLAFVKDVAK